jgi:hypothetical protein
VIAWVLAVKFLLFTFAPQSFYVIEDKPLGGISGWFGVWNHWDTRHYLQIAQFGYSAAGVTQSYYPLFPWLIRLVAIVTRSYFVAGFIVAGVCSVAAAILLRRLVRLDFSARVAMLSVWFFMIFPTSYFLHIPYTEGLFLALSLGSLLAARSGRWGLAGLLGGLGWMTRPTGVVLAPVLAMEAAHQYWEHRRWNWRWLWIGIVPCGFIVYVLVNWYVSGDPLTFMRNRETVFTQSFATPWHGIREAFLNLRRKPSEAEMIGFQNLFFAILGLVCLVFSWIKLRPLYAMWMTVNWLLVTGATFLLSVPRYTLTMFPIFILFALAARNRFWAAIITLWSILFLALFASVFAINHWAF